MGRYPSAVLHKARPSGVAEPPFGGSIIIPSPHHRHMRGSAPRLRFARIALVQMHRRRVPRKLRADPFGKRRKVSGKCVFSFQGPVRDVRS